MLDHPRLLPLFIASALTISNVTWSAPITFRASGTIESLLDTNDDPAAPLLLDRIAVGTPWELAVTFDPATPGVNQSWPTTFYYADAITAARFRLGQFTYTNAGGDIATNLGLPIGAGPDDSGFSGQGLVQFQFAGGWTGGSGGPNLNAGSGLLLASWNDVNAVDGSLPTNPELFADQAILAGLLFDTFSAPDFRAQFGSGFSPALVVDAPAAIPEPGTVLMLGAGIAAMVATRLRRRDR